MLKLQQLPGGALIAVLAILAVLSMGILSACDSAASASSAPVRTTSVDLPPSYRFEPSVIQVAAGSTVTWTNHDNFTHAVQVQNGEEHDMKPGQGVSIQFDKPGEYSYICTYHPQDMKGKVIVTAP